MNINLEVAVASAAAGTDVIADEAEAQVGYGRMLVASALIGGNAVAEPVMDIKVGGRKVKTVRGSATGLGLLNTHFIPTRAWVEAGERVQAVIVTAPTVSPILVDLEFVP